MEESSSAFPFRKLVNDKYLTLEIMMYLEYEAVLKFMFELDKESRNFLLNNSLTIRNAFINEGLIVYHFKNYFDSYEQLERLYFLALKRKI